MSFSHIITCCRLLTVLSAYYLWYRIVRCNYALFLRHTFQTLRNENILFTKIFQSLANSANLTLTPECRTELQPFTNQVSYTNDEIDDAAIDEAETTYGVTMDRRVINAGMIALVFRGIRRTEEGDQPVMLKLKRIGITEHLQRGCNDVTTLYSYAAYWFPQNIYIRVLRPFIRTINDIIEQCDFNREIQNLQKAKTDFEELEFIKIPTVYNTGPTNYILMEQIIGTHRLPPNTTDEERFRYLGYFCTFVSFSVLSNSIQHTDLHSGNVLFTANGIGIIDYGMAMQLSDEMHDMALSILGVMRGTLDINKMSFPEVFGNFFVPPVSPEEVENTPEINELGRAVMQPLLDSFVFDELNLTDSILRVSRSLNRELVFHPQLYKVLLSACMMSGVTTIMDRPLSENDAQRVHEVELLSAERAYMLIMGPSLQPASLVPPSS